MATSLNRVSLIGNLGADAELRYMSDGVPVATSTWLLPKRGKTNQALGRKRLNGIASCSTKAWRKLQENISRKGRWFT